MFTRSLPLFLLIFAATAQPSEGSRPANFRYEEDDKQLVNLIKYPKDVSGKVELVLNCVSRIQPSGKMKDTGCFTKNQYEQTFNSQVIRAAKKARMIPALINGKAYEIYLQFRVEFAAEKDEMLVRLYPNTGYEENVLEYGDNHTGGQRAIGKKEPWNDACPSHARYSVWVRAYLGEDGRAESPTIEFGNGLRPIATCLDAIKQTIINSKYAPAMSNGVFVPSTYVELFGN